MNDGTGSEMRRSSGNRSTWRKCTPVPLYLPQISYDLNLSLNLGCCCGITFYCTYFKGKQPFLTPHFLTNLWLSVPKSIFFELLCTEDPQIICLHKNIHLNEIQFLNFVVRHTCICKALWIILPWHSYATSAVHSHGELIYNLPTIKHLNSFTLHRRESLRSKTVKKNLHALYWTRSLINMFSQPRVPVRSQVSSVLTPTYPVSSSSSLLLALPSDLIPSDFIIENLSVLFISHVWYIPHHILLDLILITFSEECIF